MEWVQVSAYLPARLLFSVEPRSRFHSSYPSLSPPLVSSRYDLRRFPLLPQQVRFCGAGGAACSLEGPGPRHNF